jgi:hypothetical protein
MTAYFPNHLNPLQWHQSQGVARQVCARIFRDGGTPADAMQVFGLTVSGAKADWCSAVDRIAESLCSFPRRKAA